MHSSPSLTSGLIQAWAWVTLAARLRWVSMAALATPVVPPVYCRQARSSWVSATSSKGASRPARSAWPRRRAPGIDQAGTMRLTRRTTKSTRRPLSGLSSSPIEVTSTFSTGVLGNAFCSVAAKLSATTMARAPASASWCSSSWAVYSGLQLTTTQPARSVPNRQTGYCSRLGIISATRSPLRRPLACSQAAKSRVRRSSSA